MRKEVVVELPKMPTYEDYKKQIIDQNPLRRKPTDKNEIIEKYGKPLRKLYNKEEIIKKYDRK